MECKMISVNVGGTMFQTTDLTLSKSPYFKELLQDGKDIFVDRDPRYFAEILNYLRSGLLTCPNLLSYCQLELEMDYFGVPLHMEDFGEGTDAKRKQAQHQKFMRGTPNEFRELMTNGFTINIGAQSFYKDSMFNNDVLPKTFGIERDALKAMGLLMRHFIKYGWKLFQKENTTYASIWILNKS